jgi:hypothetical protein
LAGLISLVLTTFMDMETNMANTPKILIIDAVTNVKELRDMNAEELAQYEIDKAKDAEVKAAAQAKETAKAAILERLGITADEAKLLLT